MRAWLDDTRMGIRTILRRPRFFLAASVCLVLGVGLNIAVFDLLDRLFLRPPRQVERPATLRRVYLGVGPNVGPMASHPTYQLFRTSGTVLEDITAFSSTHAIVGRGAEARRVRVMFTTPNYFSMLGVRAASGRFFPANGTAEEQVPGCVLRHSYWQQVYGGEEALGTSLSVGPSHCVVLGVAPRGFSGTEMEAPDLWLPLAAVPRKDPLGIESTQVRWLEMLVRLASPEDSTQAAAELTVLYRSAARPESFDAGTTIRLGPLQYGWGPGRTREVSLSALLTIVAGLVLTIAWGNVAVLFFVRAAERGREVALRLALGASRLRVLRQDVIEGMALGAFSLLPALLLGFFVRNLLAMLVLPEFDDAARGLTSPRVALFALGLAVIVGGGSALLPAATAGRNKLARGIYGRLDRRESSLLQNGLIVSQIALTTVLLLSAGLCAEGLRRLMAVDLEVDADRVLVVTVDMNVGGHGATEAASLYQRLLERAQVAPGIEAASLATSSPFLSVAALPLSIPGRDALPALEGGPFFSAVSPGYFSTLGIKLGEGRVFSHHDEANSAPVVVVNETLANLYWPGEKAVGECVALVGRSQECAEVIGVVKTREGMVLGRPQPRYYIPLGQERLGIGAQVLFVRTRGDAHLDMEMVRRVFLQEAGGVPYVEVRALSDMVARQYDSLRAAASAVGILGALAVGLAAFGVYALLSHLVTRRRSELGVRIAVGARPGQVLRLVVERAMVLAVLGASLGVLLAILSGGYLEAFVFGVSAFDSVVLVVGVGVVLVAAFLASLLPGARAARFDAAELLRSE